MFVVHQKARAEQVEDPVDTFELLYKNLQGALEKMK